MLTSIKRRNVSLKTPRYNFILVPLILITVCFAFLFLATYKIFALTPTSIPLQIVPNSNWQGDYSVINSISKKTLVYMSSKYNNGVITNLQSPNGTSNILARIPPSGAFYNHFIVWPSNDQWSMGSQVSTTDFQVLKDTSTRSGYVEWSGVWKDQNLGFISSADQRISTMNQNSSGILVIKNITTLLTTKDINNFRHLYIELGWTANDYSRIRAISVQGVKDIDISGNPGVHNFDGLTLNPGGVITAYQSNTLDASPAIMFGKLSVYNPLGNYLPFNSNRIYFRNWNTFNTTSSDTTDTMELHLTDPTKTYSAPYPFIAKAGTVVSLTYYTLVRDGAASGTWSPSLTSIQNLFSAVTNTKKPQGAVESINATTVSGWALDGDYDGPIAVNLYVDSKLYDIVYANLQHPSKGMHKFVFTLSPALATGSHSISVNAVGANSDGSFDNNIVNLAGSPKTILIK